VVHSDGRQPGKRDQPIRSSRAKARASHFSSPAPKATHCALRAGFDRAAQHRPWPEATVAYALAGSEAALSSAPVGCPGSVGGTMAAGAFVSGHPVARRCKRRWATRGQPRLVDGHGSTSEPSPIENPGAR
jgi:hypothetical protein